MGPISRNPFARALALCGGGCALAAAYGVLGESSSWDTGAYLRALGRALGGSFGFTAFLAAGILVAARAAGLHDGIRLTRWPFLFLAAAFALGLAVGFPANVGRVRERYRERFAPPGTGETEDTLPDHYRFLEALAPRVRPEDRILAVTDRYPYPDLAYWFLPPRAGGRVVERVNPKVERIGNYLRGAGSDWEPAAALERVRAELRGKRVLYDDAETDALLRESDLLIALDTALDLRPRAARAGLTESLLEWSPRKYAVRRPAGGR
ncbi:MAG TPA: hypothetical protein VFI25_09760 [Planctomycetota bacterium]|nr:hypothetical protein [Planctomycetota bacterium]